MSKKNKNKKSAIPEFNFQIPKLLSEIIIKTQPQLKRFCSDYLKYKGYEVITKKGYLYAEGNIPVMLIAHLDTVHKETVKEVYISNMGNISSPQGIGGDDRCGVYTILKLIIDTELKPYVLFAEDEEIGCVGSEKFRKDMNKYNINVNFLIEIDRRGNNDAVYYECGNPDFENFISSYGFKTDFGSFSDIAVIAPALGVAAVNLSSGYYNAHTTEEIINLPDLDNTIKRVEAIVTDVADNKTQKYEYIEAIRPMYSKSNIYGWDWDDYGYDDYYNDFQKELPENIYHLDDIVVSNIDLSQGVIIIPSDDIDTPNVVIDEFSPEACDYYIDENGNIYLFYDMLGGVMKVNGGYAMTPAGLPMQMDEWNFEIMKLYGTIEDLEDNTEAISDKVTVNQ